MNNDKISIGIHGNHIARANIQFQLLDRTLLKAQPRYRANSAEDACLGQRHGVSRPKQ